MSGRVLIARSLKYLRSVTKELFPDYPVFLTDGRLRHDEKLSGRVKHIVAIMHETKNDRYVLVDWLSDLVKPLVKESDYISVILVSDKADPERYRNIPTVVSVDFVREFVDDEYNKTQVRDCLKKYTKLGHTEEDMGQEQSYRPERLENPESDWNFLITDAIQHGWIIEKKGEYIGLEPPVNFLHRNCAANWEKIEYRGRLVSVPSHILRTFIRHNVKNDVDDAV